ncbi:MAG: WbqC family protein [Cytophagaceae bacterium]|nr:WbqC family protein [Cytophagaceae bacterium]
MIYSSNFLPCLAFMSSILKENDISINIGEQYQKQSYHTRAYILGPNKVDFINVNVKKAPNHTPIKDIKIDYSQNWNNVAWKTIQNTYKKSSYFEYYDYILEPIFSKKSEFLVDINVFALEKVFQILKIKPKISLVEYPFLEYQHEFLTFNAKKRLDLPENYLSVPYYQIFGNTFEPNLSIIDLLFSKGPDSLEILRKSASN